MIKASAFLILLFLVFTSVSNGQEVLVLDPKPTDLSKEVSETLIEKLDGSFVVTDSQLGRDQIKQLGFDNPFNLSTEEAKRFGVRVGSDFVILIKSETIRRSEFGRPVYFESYFALYLVESRSGELVDWFYKRFEEDRREDAKRKLLEALSNESRQVISAVNNRFRSERKRPFSNDIPSNYRSPLPYRRMQPKYTSLASRYGITATIDANVTISKKGSVEDIRIERWAGFGLEESVIDNIKRMQWRPADSRGKPFTMSILLRYNFRDLENKKPS